MFDSFKPLDQTDPGESLLFFSVFWSAEYFAVAASWQSPFAPNAVHHLILHLVSPKTSGVEKLPATPRPHAGAAVPRVTESTTPAAVGVAAEQTVIRRPRKPTGSS